MSIECVVRVSGGLSSAIAWERALDRFGPDGTVGLFADTLIEDCDLYRFLVDLERHFEHKLTRIADGRTPFETFQAERFLGNSRVDPCSRILKRELMDRWACENAPDSIQAFGLNWDEDDRIARIAKRSKQLTWFPLTEQPHLGTDEMAARVRSWGIEIPRLYTLGFAHNNCGGGCVKAGQAQWRLLLRTMPERYARWEREEETLRAELGDVSILKHRSGPQKGQPLTLRAFRERLERQPLLFDQEDRGAACDCMGAFAVE